jgi:5-methylthioadenosine/S-adenosylhomocysteine deaminase
MLTEDPLVSGSKAPHEISLLVRHAYVLTMDDEERVIEDGAIAVDGSRIVAVGTDTDVSAEVRASKVIDARGAPVHPGLVESHLHASYHIYRGALADDIPEGAIFSEFMDQFMNGVDEDEEYHGSLLAIIEMVRNGTTCFLEAGSAHAPDAVARAARLVGMRAVLGDPFICDQPDAFAMGNVSSDAPAQKSRLSRTPRNIQEATERLGHQIERNADPDALITGHVAVRGLGTASEELLLIAKRLADDSGTVLNMHHAYSPADTEAARRAYQADPLVHLAKLGVLGPNVTLGHANQLTEAERDVVIESGANIAWGPSAAAMWGLPGSFTGRHAEIWRGGGNIALGSDSGNWSNDFDVFRQAKAAILGTRQASGDRLSITAEDVLTMATRGGARAAGLSDRIGSIEVGKRADLVIHTLDRPELVPYTDMVRNLIYASGSKSVHSVVIDGRVVLEEGRFGHFDEPALLRGIADKSRAMMARLGISSRPNGRRVRGRSAI